MKFHCTLVRSPGSGLQEPPLELTIQAPAGTTGSDIQTRLTHRFGTGAVSTGGKRSALPQRGYGATNQRGSSRGRRLPAGRP
jgi:hypothetical protein